MANGVILFQRITVPAERVFQQNSLCYTEEGNCIEKGNCYVE